MRFTNNISFIAALIFCNTACFAVTPAEEAVFTRYFTQVLYGLKHQETRKPQKQSEAIAYGLLIYHYYAKSDPEFSKVQRRLLAQALIQTNTKVSDAIKPFNTDISRYESNEQAQAMLGFFGFDASTALQIVTDSKKDSMKEFQIWLLDDPKYRTPQGRALQK